VPKNFLYRLALLVSFHFFVLASGLLPLHSYAAINGSSCNINFQDKELIGVWESRQTSKGGIGLIMEFREDGGWVDTFGAIVDSSGETPPAFVGVQKLPGTTGDGFAFMNFMADGKVQYREPVPKPWGCYEIVDSKLRLCSVDCRPVVINYKVTKTTLELMSEQGSQTLHRVEPAWYRPLNEDEVADALKSFNAKRAREKD